MVIQLDSQFINPPQAEFTARQIRKILSRKIRDKGLMLGRVELTISRPLSNKKFIKTPYDQEVPDKVLDKLRAYVARGYSVYGISHDYGVRGGYKLERNLIKQMRYTLDLCPYLDRIYCSIDDDIAWVITQETPMMDHLPLAVPTFSRYKIYRRNYQLGEFREPYPGLIKVAIADWVTQHSLFTGYSLSQIFKPEHLKQENIPIIFISNDPQELVTAKVTTGFKFFNQIDINLNSVALRQFAHIMGSDPNKFLSQNKYIMTPDASVEANSSAELIDNGSGEVPLHETELTTSEILETEELPVDMSTHMAHVDIPVDCLIELSLCANPVPKAQEWALQQSIELGFGDKLKEAVTTQFATFENSIVETIGALATAPQAAEIATHAITEANQISTSIAQKVATVTGAFLNAEN